MSDRMASGIDGPELRRWIMAVGNGVIWIVDTGRDLKPGDYLMSSHVPGHAMVDPGTYPMSHIMAKLAEKIDWDDVDETVEYNGQLVKRKLVSVLFTTFVINNRPVASQ